MDIHRSTRLTSQQREDIYRKYHAEHVKVTVLVMGYPLSRPTNSYNSVKPHKSIGDSTDGKRIYRYFFEQNFVNT